MMRINYKIEFFSYWHASSGLSGGTYADSLVIKDSKGLPYLPGRTIKGLFRDSAIRIAHFSNEKLVTQQFIHQIFGVRPTGEQIDQEAKTLGAFAFFGNAQLSGPVRNAIEQEEGLEKYFYKVHSSTKIDDHGIAVDQSLRQMEVVVPLTLFGFIEDIPDNDAYETQLQYCMQGVKRLGLNRNRGLGRCKISII